MVLGRGWFPLGLLMIGALWDGASFRRVIKGNPARALAASSRLWLQLIENDEMLIKATPNTFH